MRSKNIAGFRTGIVKARKFYDRAAHGYRSRKLRGLELRSEAWKIYLGFYLAKTASEKKRALDKAWRVTKQALELSRRFGNDLEFATTYDQLSTTLALGYDFQWNSKGRQRKFEEAIEHGRYAVRSLSSADNEKLLARIYARMALFLDAEGDEAFQFEKQLELDREGIEYWRTAERLDREEAVLQAAYPPSGFFRILDEEECARICEEGLRFAEAKGDNFATGWQLDQVAGRTFFKVFPAADRSESIKIAEQSLRLAEEAQERHELVNLVTPNNGVIWSQAPYAEHFLQLSWFQSDPSKRRAFLRKAREETRTLLREARRSSYPRVIAYAASVTSKILEELADSTENKATKRRLLQSSLIHRLESARIYTGIMPNGIHPVGTVLRHLADVKSALADLEDNHQRKVQLLRSALKDKERGLELNTKYAENVARGQPHLVQRLVGKNYLEYGDLLTRLYKIARDEDLLPEIAKAYSDAAKMLKQTTALRGLGEAYWKSGEAYDRIRANLAAAESFDLAAKTYQDLFQKNQHMGSLFQDYARYLEAWSNIEYARVSHRRLAYDESEKFYEKAASLHQSAGRWSFLSPYYSGLARLEAAENLSRSGHSSQSISTFKDAAQLFRESSISLHKHAALTQEPEEKAMVERMAGAFQEQYSFGRAMIEEARVAEDHGDYRTSTDKFDEASRTFENASKSASLKREQDELLYISTLSKAWKEMAQTAGSGSNQGFTRAAALFEKSLEYSPDETARDVAMGHKYFCEALAASGQFTYTLNSAFYETGVKYLTIASSHFAGAGFSVQSMHAQACKLLLDAHAEIAKSSREPDVGESARGYEAARKILQEAGEGFARAHQTAKQQQVQRLIDSVGQRLGLSQRLEEISKTTANISPTVAFPTPARGEEAPIGHSRFAGADLEARFTDSTSKGSKPGEDVLVEITVANTGSQPIRLLKIKDVIPYNARPCQGPYRTDGDSVLLDQRRLDPMKLETFQIKLLPKNNSPIITRPRILFSDDSGRHRETELRPRILTASPILEFLAREFLTDYRNARLARDHSGWRTLTSVVKALKIPRSQVYGEPRWGREYGRPLEALMRSGCVESRTFPGERGRGGLIVKIRLAYDNEIARRYAEELLAAKC